MLSDSLRPLPSLVFLLPFSPPPLPTSPLFFYNHEFLFRLEMKRVYPGPSVRTWVWNSPSEPGGLTSGYSTIAQILIGLFLVLWLVLLLLSDCWKSLHSLGELTPCRGSSLQVFLPHSASCTTALLIASLLWNISLSTTILSTFASLPYVLRSCLNRRSLSKCFNEFPLCCLSKNLFSSALHSGPFKRISWRMVDDIWVLSFCICASSLPGTISWKGCSELTIHLFIRIKTWLTVAVPADS